MKKLLLILLFTTAIINAQNEEYTHSLKGIKKVKIYTNVKTKVATSVSSELKLSKIDKRHEKEKNEKAKGLTPIYAGGKDNTNGFGFSIKKENDVLILRDLKSYIHRKAITISLPKNINVSINAGTLGSIRLDGFSSEVEAETNVGTITMQNVTGPITAFSSTGAITIDFSRVNQSSPISIGSATGEIDIALPTNTKANLSLDTTLGTVYTNFDIKTPSKKGMKNVSSLRHIETTINNGGVKIKLQSSTGNIYLRKKK